MPGLSSGQEGSCASSGSELCLAASQVYYLHRYVSYYRKTDVSISHSTRGSAFAASSADEHPFIRLVDDIAAAAAQLAALG